MTKLTFEMELSDFTVNLFRLAEAQLKAQGKLAKPLDWSGVHLPGTDAEGAAGEGELQAVIVDEAVRGHVPGMPEWRLFSLAD